jgi:hypothetical protein
MKTIRADIAQLSASRHRSRAMRFVGGSHWTTRAL